MTVLVNRDSTGRGMVFVDRGASGKPVSSALAVSPLLRERRVDGLFEQRFEACEKRPER